MTISIAGRKDGREDRLFLITDRANFLELLIKFDLALADVGLIPTERGGALRAAEWRNLLSDRSDRLSPLQLRRALESIHDHLAQRFALQPVADATGVSTYHFCHAFKQSVGGGSEYIVRLRIEYAKRLLRETDCSIMQIAMAVGYRSPSHFACVFRKHVGVEPRAFR